MPTKKRVFEQFMYVCNATPDQLRIHFETTDLLQTNGA